MFDQSQKVKETHIKNTSENQSWSPLQKKNREEMFVICLNRMNSLFFLFYFRIWSLKNIIHSSQDEWSPIVPSSNSYTHYRFNIYCPWCQENNCFVVSSGIHSVRCMINWFFLFNCYLSCWDWFHQFNGFLHLKIVRVYREGRGTVFSFSFWFWSFK